MFSLRLYLKSGWREKGDSWAVEKDSKAVGVYQGRNVYQLSGQPFIILNSFDFLSVDVQSELFQFVGRVSLMEKFVTVERRRCGVYEGCDVKARLERMDDNQMYCLQVVGRNFETVRQMHKAIRGGTMQPTDDWEAPQKPGPLEQQVRELSSKLDRLLEFAMADKPNGG